MVFEQENIRRDIFGRLIQQQYATERGSVQKVGGSEVSFYNLAELRLRPVMEERVGNRSSSVTEQVKIRMYRKQEEKLRSRLQEEPILEVILDKKAERTSAIGFTDLLRSFAAKWTHDKLPSSVPLSSESHPYFLLSFLSRPHSFCFLAVRRTQTSQSFMHAMVI